MDTIRVFIVDLPSGIKAMTLHNDDDSYTILVNTGISHQMQCEAYGHEIDHINSGDFNQMYDVGAMEMIRHSA